MNNYYILALISCVFSLQTMYAQSTDNKFKLLISSRVDTTSKEVNSIISLYENYFNSNPDSIYDNPYWNTTEKNLYNDFDFSRASIFQGGFNATNLHNYFSPFVMSVEPIGSKFQIRVLYSSSTTDPTYAGSKVWCIHKLNALKENGNWVFENLIVEHTKLWQSDPYGVIEYIYPTTHTFNTKQAMKAQKYCSKIAQRFNPNYNSKFKYYITNSTDEMGLLENFDYYFAGITTGKAREGMITTSLGIEYYPHEFVHQILPKNENRAYIIEEGLAVFLGTKEDKEEYNSLIQKLALIFKVIQNNSILNQSCLKSKNTMDTKRLIQQGLSCVSWSIKVKVMKDYSC